MKKTFHKNYCLFSKGYECTYDSGEIRHICWETAMGKEPAKVQVYFVDGRTYQWATKWISSYILQFGIAVSFDGKYVFVQTWENGLLCLDSCTGEIVWRTKSKRGITNIFVNEDTILCHQHEYALQLLNIHTGEVLIEKRPATAWGFTPLDHKHIVCQVTVNRWEIIDTQTLETKQKISNKVFTDAHEDYCIKDIVLIENRKIKVSGFKNVWDDSVKPPVRLPNLEFEHYVEFGQN